MRCNEKEEGQEGSFTAKYLKTKDKREKKYPKWQ